MKPNWLSGSSAFAFLFLYLAILQVAAQPLQLGPARIINRSVQFQVLGPTNVYHRVDVSYDMANWLPIDLYFTGRQDDADYGPPERSSGEQRL